MEPLEQATFSIESHPIGGRVIINGQDITPLVASIEFNAGGREPSALLLRMVPLAGKIEGNGVVYVLEPQADFRTWLKTLDPAAIQQMALDKETFGGGTFTENLLETIREMFDAAES